MTDAEILKRKHAREAATTAAELLLGEAARLDSEAQGWFWEWIRHCLPPPPSVPTTAVEPFSDAQAAAWGRNRMQFGQHKGERVDEVPLDYLEYLADANDFQKQLRRYLASRRIRTEQADAET